MNILNLLSILTSAPVPGSDKNKEILRDFPGCGRLGDVGKKECYWGCQWGENNASFDVFKLLSQIGKIHIY